MACVQACGGQTQGEFEKPQRTGCGIRRPCTRRAQAGLPALGPLILIIKNTPYSWQMQSKLDCVVSELWPGLAPPCLPQLGLRLRVLGSNYTTVCSSPGGTGRQEPDPVGPWRMCNELCFYSKSKEKQENGWVDSYLQ